MEEYQGEAKSYEDAKLRAILAVLETKGIHVTDEDGKISIIIDKIEVATLNITRDNADNN